jgi:hypothetical protein
MWLTQKLSFGTWDFSGTVIEYEAIKTFASSTLNLQQKHHIVQQVILE